MHKIQRIVVLVLLSFTLAAPVSAATVTWAGGGGDNNWSTAANWDTNTVPGNADDVIIDGTADLTIDGFVFVTSIDVKATYSGAITKGVFDLITGGNFTMAGGTFGGGSSNITVSGDFSQTGGTFNQDVATVAVSGNYSQTGGTFTGGTGNITVTGTFSLSSGSFTASKDHLNVGGNFAHTGGTFAHNGGTANLTGNGQTISGNTTFYNFQKRVNVADTLTMMASSRQTIENVLVLKGAAGQLLTIVSSMGGTAWEIDQANAPATIEYVDLSDSTNVNAAAIRANSATCVDSGNNTNWNFAATPVPASGWVNGQDALYVLGQADFTSSISGTTDDKFNKAKDVALDLTNNKMYVADRGNHRVLRFAYPVTGNQPSAELVFGQADFTSFGAGTTRDTFEQPQAIAVDNTGRIWISEAGNNRVVWFDNAHAITANQPEADGVLGQADFISKTNPDPPTASSMNAPYGIALDSLGNLYVADGNNHRVLRFDNAVAKANGAAADAVFGQPDLISNTENNGGISASSMAKPLGTYMYGTSLFVTDRSNGRVLRFDNAAARGNGTAADHVLGQPDFTTNTHVTNPATQNQLDYCGKMEVDGGGNLYVSDGFHNDRVVIYNDVLSKPMGGDADHVLGQVNFTDAGNGVARNRVNLDSHGGGMALDNVRNLLFLSDDNNNRVLVFKKNVVDPEFNLRQGGVYSPSGTTFDYDGGTSLTFTIDNPGGSNLVLNGSPIVRITGANADQFRVTTQPATTIAPQTSTSFTVDLSASSTGVKNAVVTIASNDVDESLFTLNLSANATAIDPGTGSGGGGGGGGGCFMGSLEGDISVVRAAIVAVALMLFIGVLAHRLTTCNRLRLVVLDRRGTGRANR